MRAIKCLKRITVEQADARDKVTEHFLLNVPVPREYVDVSSGFKYHL